MQRFLNRKTGIILIMILITGWFAWNFGLNVYAVAVPPNGAPADCPAEVRFAVIGDYGEAGEKEARVAALVDSLAVDFIITAGDNNYEDGEAATIDANIGQYYHAYIHPYKGGYGSGADENRFFPALGNHDWNTGTVRPYLDYFTLPGNGRYYDFVKGPVHFFVLDSDPHEPDGNTRDSLQARWLEEQMAGSAAPWRLVILHHPPSSSSLLRAGYKPLQWPFARWGASAIITGHVHLYERLRYDGVPQFTVGIGGRSPIHRFGPPVASSEVRYNQSHGAMLVTAGESCINFTLYNIQDELVDSYTIRKENASRYSTPSKNEVGNP